MIKELHVISGLYYSQMPFTLKSILRQKKTYKKTQIFHHAKIYNLPKKILPKKNPKYFKIL
jgi:hypothetical protein